MTVGLDLQTIWTGSQIVRCFPSSRRIHSRHRFHTELGNLMDLARTCSGLVGSFEHDHRRQDLQTIWTGSQIVRCFPSSRRIHSRHRFHTELGNLMDLARTCSGLVGSFEHDHRRQIDYLPIENIRMKSIADKYVKCVVSRQFCVGNDDHYHYK
ncbi:hypothetical protein AHF37_01202 [Paragonimus kellicotti]|nr:hypothetical protein AHF37_01202 [Paragonimus kellicotti]